MLNAIIRFSLQNRLLVMAVSVFLVNRSPDEPVARRLLDRIQITYTPTTAVFRPGRFKRSVTIPLVDELGPSHKH